MVVKMEMRMIRVWEKATCTLEDRVGTKVGFIDGSEVGRGVGTIPKYVGTSDGLFDGAKDKNDDGSAVGLPATYVGDKDGDCVGIDDGVDVGRGVGVPTE